MSQDERERHAYEAAVSLWSRLRMQTSPMSGYHLGLRQYGVTFWDESTSAVLDILANALLKPPGGAIGSTYGNVVLLWTNAICDADYVRADQLHILEQALRQEFPQECQAWSDYWSPKAPPTQS